MLKAVIKVEGMMCPMCEAHTNEAIRNAINVKKVTSSHKDKETVVIAESIDETVLREAIEKTGYKVLGVEICEYSEKGFFAKLFKK